MSAQRLLSHSILVAALATVAGGALAASDTEGARRADVKALVLQARASGELKPAGEAIEPFTVMTTSHSALSRRSVRDDTMLARALGQLVPAGEGMLAPAVSTGTAMARADVRESVRQARVHGELIPAGEGIGPVAGQARARMAHAERVAASTRR